VVKHDTEAMKLIPGTSNIVERLFSQVAHLLVTSEVDGCLHPRGCYFSQRESFILECQYGE
jgi:hypothetical protein